MQARLAGTVRNRRLDTEESLELRGFRDVAQDGGPAQCRAPGYQASHADGRVGPSRIQNLRAFIGVLACRGAPAREAFAG